MVSFLNYLTKSRKIHLNELFQTSDLYLNFISFDILLAKAFFIFVVCLVVRNNSCRNSHLQSCSYFLSSFHSTEKYIFIFQMFWKDDLSKKSHWNMIFLVSRRMILLFPGDMILFFRHKKKDDLSQKVPGNIIFSSNVLKRLSFQNIRAWTRSILKYLQRWYFFFSKYMKFVLWVENERRWSLSKNAWQYDIFCIYA